MNRSVSRLISQSAYELVNLLCSQSMIGSGNQLTSDFSYRSINLSVRRSLHHSVSQLISQFSISQPVSESFSELINQLANCQSAHQSDISHSVIESVSPISESPSYLLRKLIIDQQINQFKSSNLPVSRTVYPVANL